MTKFIVTTTSSLEGFEIKAYLGTVSTNVVAGTGIFSDFAADFRDFFGGRSKSYQKQLKAIYEEVEEKIVKQAKRLGANAVVGYHVDFDEISGKSKQMLMVSALGTAVYIVQTVESKSYLDKNNHIKSYIGADELNEQLHIETILTVLKAGDYSKINDVAWDLLIKYKEYRAIDFIITAVKDIPNGDPFKEKAREFFATLPDEELKKIIYSNLDADISFFPYAVSIIKDNQLLDIDYVLKMLDSKEIDIKKAALHLAKTDKEFYSVEDIRKLELLVQKIESAFPDISMIETKKGLIGSREKWKCGFCNNYNDIEVEYCMECDRTKKGFKADELKPEKIISVLNNSIKILKLHFKANNFIG